MRDLSKIVDQLEKLTISESNTLAAMLRSQLEKPRKPSPLLTRYEGEVCDAMVKRLEEREGRTRDNLRWPETENHKHPVDLAFTLGDQLYALEHTVVEPFDGHIRMEAQTETLFAPISNALKDSLGTDALFQLNMPINTLDGLKPAELARVQQSIVTWVKETAPTIPKPTFPDHSGNIAGPTKPTGVPCDVVLIRYEPPIFPGKYFEIRHLVDDMEKRRAARMQVAIDKKFPKLAAWKANEGAKTILVLEQNDIQITNINLITDTYLPLVKERTDRPDETYLVASCLGPPAWWMYPVLIGDRSYYDIMQTDETSYWEFDPSSLISLTKR
ncbi:hypothetical protein S58_16520 [Bradyrhizobium oligotrophicum S58]|uniref:Uncharacterized protein n=1 Tax=Bradyrhizobium oligotrophicum S58 TaxID=1245469 RepID=M4ZN74_9BRAD|nr:hypothetical protein [Bradyrhizobium oligotrophicum]BAM87660.1 hypothetical protein S58_16520 [Bradyrhizobium oligotrophicum S58]